MERIGSMGQHRNPAAAERVDDPKPESYHRRAASGEGIVFDGADIKNPKSPSRVLKKGEVGLPVAEMGGTCRQKR